jgi:hypothetical protein
MKYSNWLGFAAALTIIAVCYTTWVYIPSVKGEIGGMQSNFKHNFGRPGMLHLVFAGLSAIFFMLPFVWAKRTNIFITGFNMAWAIRNYIVLTKCYGGDCAEKKPGLYLLLVATALLLLMSLLPDLKLASTTKKSCPTNL